jgi:hypothetical protein
VQIGRFAFPAAVQAVTFGTVPLEQFLSRQDGLVLSCIGILQHAGGGWRFAQLRAQFLGFARLLVPKGRAADQQQDGNAQAWKYLSHDFVVSPKPFAASV